MRAQPGAIPAWLNAALEEYSAQRTLQADAFNTAQKNVALGGTVVGVLFAAAFGAWRYAFPSTAVFLVVIPIVSATVVTQWCGEQIDASQSADYLRRIEVAIRDALPDPPDVLFTWEPTFANRFGISDDRWWVPDRRWLRHAAIGTFGLLAAGSIAVGVYHGYGYHPVVVVVIAAVEFVALSGLAFALARELIRAMQAIRDPRIRPGG
jgi:hypothetical protein